MKSNTFAAMGWMSLGSAVLGTGSTLLLVAYASGLWGVDAPPFNTAAILTVGIGGNILAGVIFILLRYVLHPLRRMTQMMQLAQQNFTQEHGELTISTLSLREAMRALTRFAAHAQEAYAQCRTLQHELMMAQELMAMVTQQQHAIISSTNHEMMEQYRNVLAYAHYLDEHIQANAPDAQLRYDFDDVCESGFNLKLIAHSLELLRQPVTERCNVPLSDLLQQTILALAPSLERRSMKLSTLGADESVMAHTHFSTLAHAVWIMLLGTIRYAADESTLRLRCLPLSEGDEVMLSVVVSELAPGQLTPEERHTHLARQLQHITPHMFAETIRIHGNLQLAEWMLKTLDGRISILPITHYACEICLFLPAAKK